MFPRARAKCERTGAGRVAPTRGWPPELCRRLTDQSIEEPSQDARMRRCRLDGTQWRAGCRREDFRCSDPAARGRRFECSPRPGQVSRSGRQCR